MSVVNGSSIEESVFRHCLQYNFFNLQNREEFKENQIYLSTLKYSNINNCFSSLSFRKDISNIFKENKTNVFTNISITKNPKESTLNGFFGENIVPLKPLQIKRRKLLHVLLENMKYLTILILPACVRMC